MPNVGSRKASGSGVPHFWSTNWRVLTNTTSAGNGVVPPVPRPIRPDRIGMLEVVMVCRPGPSTSRARPSRKKTAAWLSRTTAPPAGDAESRGHRPGTWPARGQPWQGLRAHDDRGASQGQGRDVGHGPQPRLGVGDDLEDA